MHVHRGCQRPAGWGARVQRRGRSFNPTAGVAAVAMERNTTVTGRRGASHRMWLEPWQNSAAKVLCTYWNKTTSTWAGAVRPLFVSLSSITTPTMSVTAERK